jgi:hypothetical protein
MRFPLHGSHPMRAATHLSPPTGPDLVLLGKINKIAPEISLPKFMEIRFLKAEPCICVQQPFYGTGRKVNNSPPAYKVKNRPILCMVGNGIGRVRARATVRRNDLMITMETIVSIKHTNKRLPRHKVSSSKEQSQRSHY